jgi:hypothetical protein
MNGNPVLQQDARNLHVVTIKPAHSYHKFRENGKYYKIGIEEKTALFNKFTVKNTE